MKLSFLRPVLLLALTAGVLAGCGGKATFPINVTIIKDTKFAGLTHPDLTLTDTISGQKLVIKDVNQRTAVFPNTLEYGTEFNITAEAPHQECVVSGGQDTAGRRESIQVLVGCNVATHTLTVTVVQATGANIVGLKVSNPPLVYESTAQTPLTVAVFPDLPYGTSYSATVFAQPADGVTKCKFAAPANKPPTMQVSDSTIADTIGDANVTLTLNCAKS